jgi:hypothetical protein
MGFPFLCGGRIFVDRQTKMPHRIHRVAVWFFEENLAMQGDKLREHLPTPALSVSG